MEGVWFGWGLLSQYAVFKDRFPSHNSFRRQYEQLQTVIVRVLRPAAPTSGSGQPVGGATTPTDQGEAGMETDDMSAVREVRLAYENVKVVDCLDLTPEGNASWEAALKRYVHLYTLQTSVTLISYCYLKIFQSGMLALFI